ncbi:MAG: leucine-rich repeat domain-containing protein, partial [Clostridia bacterium]|nr:leucine-rich repeat domain-containing protein [Clostridia bacterium]
ERIDTECFSYCNGVKSIILPPRLNYIGQNAFKDCSSAEIIEISSKPSFIGEGAFRNCAKAVLRFVNTKKAQSGWNGQCFDNRMTVIYAK